MEKFTFYKDTLKKLFLREEFVVEAESYEQAEKKAKEYLSETFENVALRGKSPVVSVGYVWDSLEDVDDLEALRILDKDKNVIATN